MRGVKAWRKICACICVLSAVVLAAAPAAAKTPDRPENKYVLDSAGVISDRTEKEIVRRNQELFRECGAEIVIAAVDFLGGEDIEDYANDMFNDWGIGSRERDNGVLLVMAIGEEDYYATSGKGIDGYFNAARFRDLFDRYLEDDFAAGDYDAGALGFFNAAAQDMESYYSADHAAPVEDGVPDDQEDAWYSHNSFFSRAGAVIFALVRVAVVVVVLLVVFAFLRGIGRGGGGGYGGGGGGFWQGMFLGSMMNSRRRRSYWSPPPPPPPGHFGGFGGPRGPRPPQGGFGGGRPGGFGGFHGGGGSRGGGIGRSGGFHGGGSSRGGGAGRR